MGGGASLIDVAGKHRGQAVGAARWAGRMSATPLARFLVDVHGHGIFCGGEAGGERNIYQSIIYASMGERRGKRQ
jgi:hypothetical protein